MDKIYHIGTLNQPWGEAEKAQWLSEQSVKRSFFTEVLPAIDALKNEFEVEQYGELDYQHVSGKTYPLFAVKSRNWQSDKPTVLVTGGVHGYETSGVHGALRFLQTKAKAYSEKVNILVLPCISPWGYETINRWTPEAVDPNRSFSADGQASEALANNGPANDAEARFHGRCYGARRDFGQGHMPSSRNRSHVRWQLWIVTLRVKSFSR